MKELKKLSMKRITSTVVILLLLGGVLLVMAGKNFLKLQEGPADLYTLDYTSNLDGTYVSGTIYVIYDYYCETTRDGRLLSREYIIDAGEEDYMGMLVAKKDMPAAEKLMNAYADYVDEKVGEESVYAAQYEVTGTIRKMPSDSRKVYYQYLREAGFTPEEQEMFLPYYLEQNAVGELPIIGIYLLGALGIVCLIIALYMTISALTGRYQKQVSDYIASSMNPDMTREKVELFLESTKNNYGLRCDKDFLCGQSGARTVFRETSELVWAYGKNVTHKRNFITVGHSYYLVMVFADRTYHELDVKNKNAATVQLEKLALFCPQAILGYTDQLSALYRKNFSELLDIKYNKMKNGQMF